MKIFWTITTVVIVILLLALSLVAFRALIVLTGIIPILLGLVVFLAVAVLIGVIPITRWYAMALMAKYDFVFTNVPESYFKVVVRSGGHRKTLLSKKGYKIDKKGDITKLKKGESPETSLPGGLRLIGWPFIDKVYKRPMKFLKSLPDGEIKPYNVENVDEFYARVDYPYALLFTKCEDNNNLPLSGHATLLAHVVNPNKSLFETANFYDTMIGLVLPSVRECLKGFSFDKLKKKDNLDEIIWAKFGEPNPRHQNSVSVFEELKKYGIVIVALRIVNIDPQDEELRNIGLTKYRAEREADAAEAIAKKEGIIAGGPLNVLMDQWLKTEAQNRNIPLEADGSFNREKFAELVAELKKDGNYASQSRIFKELILADAGNLQILRNELGSPDGSPLPSSLQYLSMGGGGGMGVMFPGQRRGGQGRGSTKGGGQQRKDELDDTDDDEEKDQYEKQDKAAGMAFEKRYGFRAPWDPRGTST